MSLFKGFRGLCMKLITKYMAAVTSLAIFAKSITRTKIQARVLPLNLRQNLTASSQNIFQHLSVIAVAITSIELLIKLQIVVTKTWNDLKPRGGGTPIHYLQVYVPPNGVVFLKLPIQNGVSISEAFSRTGYKKLWITALSSA